MNNRVRTMMFDTPVTVYPMSGIDSTGDRNEIGKPFDCHGYVYDESVIVDNASGEKEVSTRQVYLPMDEIAKVESYYKITCLDKVKVRIIKRQEYRGRFSRTLIGVLYLP